MPALRCFHMEGIYMNHFCGSESESFSFYRIPKVLFSEEYYNNLCCEAKLLYGFLLDRMSLSKKNGWRDSQNRVFVIYSTKHIMKDFNCAHEKAERLLADLERFGLLKRVRRGIGLPSMLYPLKFTSQV